MHNTYYKPQNGTNCTYTKLKASGQTKAESYGPAMPQKPQKSAQTTHYIELGGYQYWPVLVPRGIRLYTYEQIPLFLRENPYITDGYRAYLPSRLCIKSCVCCVQWVITCSVATARRRQAAAGWR